MRYEGGLGLLDQNPVSTRRISGLVVDPQGIAIPRDAACVGLFDDAGAKLVAATNVDLEGRFHFSGVTPGPLSYRGSCRRHVVSED